MDIVTILILGLGIGLGFFAQTVVGFAAPLIALPFMLSVLELPEAVATLSLFLLAFSIALIYQDRKLINKKVVLELTVGGVIGLIIGIQTLKFGDPEILKKVLGLFTALYVLYVILKKTGIGFFNKMGFIFGLFGGFFSGLFTAGGPMYITYIHNKVKDMKVVRATIIGILGVTNILRIPFLIQAELLTGKVVLDALYVLPFFLLAIYLGTKCYKIIDEKLFKKIILFVLLVTGVTLIIS